MNVLLLLNAVATFAGLTFVLASLLVIADRVLHVNEDPRIEQVERMLPHTNCGACGYAGCRAFAEALVRKDAELGKCTVSPPANLDRIAEFLGVSIGTREKQVARLACAGGSNVARQRAHYAGLQTCAAASLVAGGGKSCFWGCLGLGDCHRACSFEAISLDQHALPVVDESCCTACGDCVLACPKDLFSLHSASERLWVACSSLAQGDDVVAECEVACTACGRCAADSDGKIEMKQGLPVIDYRLGPFTDEPIQRCPTGAILWIDEKGDIVKGRAAKQVIRQSEIHEAAT